MLERFREHVAYLLTLSAFLLYVYWQQGLLNVNMICWGDLTPFYLTFRHAFQSWFFTWQDVNLGAPGFGIDFNLFQGIFTFLLGENAMLVQRLYILLMLPASAISMYAFLCYLIRSRFIAVAASFLYILSPATIYSFFQMSSLTIGFIALPLLLLLFLKTVRKKINFRWLLIFSTALAFFSGLQPQIPLWIAPFILITVVAHLAFKPNLRRALKLILTTVLAAVLFILLSSTYWSYWASILGYYQTGIVTYGFQPFTIERILEGVKIDFNQPWMISNVWFYTFSIFLLAPFTLLIRERYKATITLGLLLASSLLLIFWHTSLTGKAYWLYEMFPFVRVYETYKLGMLLTFTITTLLAALTSEVWYAAKWGKMWRRVKGLRNRILSLTVVVLIFSAALAVNLQHDFVTREVHKTTPRSIDLVTGYKEWFSQGKVSEVYYEALDWIKRQPNHDGYRILWLPLDPFQYSVLRYFFLETPVYWPEDPKLVKLILIDLLFQQKTENLGQILNQVGVKYVVVNLDANSYGIYKNEGPPALYAWGEPLVYTYYLACDPRIVAENLELQKDLKLVANETRFLVYENLAFKPLIQAYSDVLAFIPKISVASDYVEYISKNALLNPDFASGIENWSVGWIASPTIVSVDLPSAKNAIRFARNDQVINFWHSVYQNITIGENADYLVSGWVKISNVNSTSVKVVFWDERVKRYPGDVRNYPIGAVDRAREWQSSDIDGTKGWFQFSGIVHSPQGAVKATLVLMAGWSLGDSNVAETWFADISFNRYYEWRNNYVGSGLVNSTLQLLQVQQILESVPYFDDKLLALGGSKEISHFIDGQIFLGGIEKTDTVESRSAPIFSIYKTGDLKVKVAEMSLNIPMNDSYKLAVIADSKPEMRIIVDDKEIALGIESFNQGEFYLHQTPSFTLNEGEHTILIKFKDETAMLHSLIITNSKVSLSTEKNPANLSFVKVNPTYYKLSLTSSRPTLIVFKSAYDPGWKALTNDKGLLDAASVELMLYRANAFYLSGTGYDEVELIYEPQKTRESLLTIWGLSWFAVLSSLVISYSPFRNYARTLLKKSITQKIRLRL